MPPEDFNRCVKKGGKVRTEKLSDRRYQHICWDDKGSHAGHIKTKKKESK